MAKISDQELEMGIASFIEKRGYAGLRVELTPQQALDIYTELQTLRQILDETENLILAVTTLPVEEGSETQEAIERLNVLFKRYRDL